MSRQGTDSGDGSSKLVLQAIIEHTGDGVLVSDLSGRVLYTSPSLLSTLGVRKDDVLGRRCLEVLPLDPPICSLENNTCSLARGASPRKLRISLKPPEALQLRGARGEARKFRLTAIPVAHMVVHILRAEDDLRQLCRHLKALEELKSNILANISHELRTPITIAKGAIDLASAEDDPAERAKYLKMALDALARLNLIVEDVIEAASFKKGATQPKFDRVDILNLITRVCRDFRPLLNRDRINLKIVSGPLPPVKGDPELLRHALRNLISNAIKFNRRGGSIIIEARSRGEEVEVCVTDTGIGIPEDELDKIFDIFYQVDASPTRRYGGTGLGLALVKEIAEAHGGEITVESQLGKGSTFCLTLPVATRP